MHEFIIFQEKLENEISKRILNLNEIDFGWILTFFYTK